MVEQHTSLFDPSEVQERHQLVQYLDQSLSGVGGEYLEIDDDLELKQRATYVKTYLVESHLNPGEMMNGAIRELFPVVQERRDSSLLLLLDRGNNPYFADFAHPRITAFHTIARTRDTDRTLDSLVSGGIPGFDRPWIPSGQMSDLTRGQLIGFRFGFSPLVHGVARSSQPEDDEDVTSVLGSVPRFSVSVKNNSTAATDFRGILDSNLFAGRRTLENVQFVARSEDKEDYVRNGIYSNGKIIGSGTSIGAHLITVDQVRVKYGDLLSEIEARRLSWEGGDERVFAGEPLLITFPSDVEITNLLSFASSIFKPSKPYRLMAIPHNASDKRVDFEVIDLHTGDPFSVELTQAWMRIYLPAGSCGNVVLRLFSHLESTFASGVSLISATGEVIVS